MGEGGERYRGVKWEEEKEKVKRRGRESEKGFRGGRRHIYTGIIASKKTPTLKCTTQTAYPYTCCI